jgi:methionyl aminopeptidase
MREASRIVRDILVELKAAALPGTTTYELDRIAEDLIAKMGAKPAFKGYKGFPGVLCTSINHEVVHGIPSKKRKLQDGDLLKLDFGVAFRGYYGDSAVTVPIGRVTPEAQKLIDVTRESLQQGIAQMVVGRRLSDIGRAVQATAEAAGFSVVRKFVGHGIGRALHESPQVPNYDFTHEHRLGDPLSNARLRPGLVLAVEPMVNAGTADVRVLDDGWTAVTADARLSAHFEHTIVVTEQGPEVLTA